jgi:ABC-type bacteriocin/lantibiotic exporter with double-glycine peptidase domain
MLQELRKKVTTLPQWSQLLNGFEKVKTATQVQNFLQELEKVVGRKFPKFLHHLSNFVFCSSSVEMTNTVLGAIVELCVLFVGAELEH